VVYALRLGAFARECSPWKSENNFTQRRKGAKKENAGQKRKVEGKQANQPVILCGLCGLAPLRETVLLLRMFYHD
jgi:hypothetical protein